MDTPKLVVLRGPSGSGKSTIANILFHSAGRKIALIDQDHYRLIFRPAGGGSRPNSDTIHKMIQNDVLLALDGGYDVILEGILSVRSYGEVLQTLFLAHPDQNYLFYFNISLEETIRRDATRVSKGDYHIEDMREWYPAAHKSDHPLEQLISEAFSIDETVAFVRKSTQL